MNKKYRVCLTNEERNHLEKLVRKGKAHARKLTYARILLKSDEQGPAWTAMSESRMLSRRVSPVLDALSGVRDSELDEPVTDLGFVSELKVENGAVSVHLRLPTYFYAPNFAYLMVADARAAVLSVPGVRQARVFLDGHHASEEINGGVNEEWGFEGTFPGDTAGEDLYELRTIFRRKSFVSRQEKLCRALLAKDRSRAGLAEMRLGEVPPSGASKKYLECRAELGLDVAPEAPLVVDPDGERVPEEVVVEHLRFARTVRVSIEGNAGFCRGVLATRYGTPGVMNARDDTEVRGSPSTTPPGL
jgi:metal-sulfur cluster biosynthetic enzyme